MHSGFCSLPGPGTCGLAQHRSGVDFSSGQRLAGKWTKRARTHDGVSGGAGDSESHFRGHGLETARAPAAGNATIGDVV